MDSHYQQYGSWSGWDAVRHWMYEDIYATLEAQTFPSGVNMFEIGVRGYDTPIGRMMMQLHETKGFGLSMGCGDYPIYDITKMPFPDNTFDIFVADQVLEHVTEIWKAAEEMYRVVKPGGLIVSANPFMFPIHNCPLDCWRIAPYGYRSLFPNTKVEELTCKTWGTMQIVAWANANPNARGFYGDWVDVAWAKDNMPEFKEPHYNADHPVVVWFVGRKK